MCTHLISVIVPVYKVEDYLDKCITSILVQTYTNLEIILVDDGSPDGCSQKCDDWALKDKRISVIHKQNGGLSSARNAGLDNCNGDLISFIDSDDWLEPNMYEVLVSSMQESNADVSVCHIFQVQQGEKVATKSDGRCYIIHDYYHMLEGMLSKGEVDIRFEVWNKLFRRSVIGENRFKVGQVYEDVYFNRVVFANAKKVVVTNTPLYNYLLSRVGATGSSFNINRITKIDELDEYIKLLYDNCKINIYNYYLCYILDSLLGFSNSAFMFQADKDTHDIIRKRFYKYYRMYITTGLHVPMKYKIFNVSPRLYKLVLSIYLKIDQQRYSKW